MTIEISDLDNLSQFFLNYCSITGWLIKHEDELYCKTVLPSAFGLRQLFQIDFSHRFDNRMPQTENTTI